MSKDRSTEPRPDDEVADIDEKYSEVDPEDLAENTVDYFREDPSTEDEKDD